MCPYDYYTTMRQSKDPKILRLKMVQHATAHSIKDAAKVFHTAIKTVQKWSRRFDGSLASLEDHSRAPHHRPRKLDARTEKKIVALKKQLPRFSARRLKHEFELPWSEKAMRRIFKEHRLGRKYRRKKRFFRKMSWYVAKKEHGFMIGGKK